MGKDRLLITVYSNNLEFFCHSYILASFSVSSPASALMRVKSGEFYQISTLRVERTFVVLFVGREQ